MVKLTDLEALGMDDLGTLVVRLEVGDIGDLCDFVKLRDLAGTARFFTAVPLARFLTHS